MDVFAKVVRRLDEADRGDRGWFIITRVHTAVGWIQGLAKYLYLKAGTSTVRFSSSDYANMAKIVGSTAPDPGIGLRRHNLLVLDKPLQIIARPLPGSWSEVRLTKLGCELAQVDDASEVLESALMQIIFAKEPSAPPDRVVKYSEFNIAAYAATARVLRKTEGWIDRDEFDFFVSRIRTDSEISWAIDCILEFRRSSNDVRARLNREVARRIPGAKEFQNWRDIALHTFSLFSLGTRMVRESNRLYLTKTWADRSDAATVTLAIEKRPQTGDEGGTSQKRRRELRIPEPPETPEYLDPPLQAINDGSDGESFVAKVLRAEGWEVIFFTRRRGYGFDLWARKERRSMFVEVKSSLSKMSALVLTENEFAAAQKYRENYVIAVAEQLASANPTLDFLVDPGASLKVNSGSTVFYTIGEADWRRAIRRNVAH